MPFLLIRTAEGASAVHDPDNSPEKLVAVSSDLEAAMIVSALAAHDLDATTSGEYTSGFRAEAPGLVEVLVRRCDLSKAREVLSQLTVQRSQESDLTTSALAVDREYSINWLIPLVILTLLGIGVFQFLN